MITAESLLAAIDRRRVALGAQTGSVEPIPYTAVAAAVGVHSALFSRLKRGTMPTPENVAKLAAWVGDESALHCATCDGFDVDDEDIDDTPDDDTPEGDDERATGAIVALLPAADDPIVAASSQEAHMTFAWLGEAANVDNAEAIIDQVRELAASAAPFDVSPRERGELGDDGADVVFMDAPDALPLREALLADDSPARLAHDAVDQYPEWTPHVTLGYPDDPATADYDPAAYQAVRIDRIAVWIGEDRHEFALGGGAAGDVFAIRAVSGRLSDSEDPETQAAVTRVRELLAEGAVGVSVMLDLHPDDAAAIGEAEKRWTAAIESITDPEEWPTLESFLPDGFVPRQRVRHTAIVDTPAYADARLDVAADGTLTGDVTYEGIYTGDVRYAAAPEGIDLEASRVPSPIIWDRTDGDHSGMTVGYIDLFERVPVSGPVAGRPVLDDEAVTASLAPLTMPAAYFARTVPAKASPIVISQPDAAGYRVIEGLAAPKGVCHRSSMSCFTLPTMDERDLVHFHTGAALRLDNGEDIRVGALTMYGGHIDTRLAKAGVTAPRVGDHRDNANQVLGLVRAFPTKFGLWIRGVIPPGASEADIAKALACAPSVELWPVGNGKRALVGIHLVPRPAWPVVASVGDVERVTSDEPVVLAEPDPDEPTPEPESEAAIVEVVEFDFAERIDRLEAKLDALTETAAAILALTPIDHVDLD